MVKVDYMFSMAIGRFSRIAKEEGRFKGVVKNIGEQL
jgi:hypothetical protein